MESVDLDMNDIFEMEDGDGDGDNFPSALPDLPEELAPLDDGGDNIPPTQDAENAEVLAKLKGMKGAGKKIVRRPQPKLDGTRLTGERGIAILPRVFKDVKFKGRGHEAEDLRITMKYLEHWAHRLFPMMPFDEVIERIEKLGSKKEVQTCIKKMRLDIPVLAQDFVDETIREKDENPPTPPRGNQGDMDAEEAFDQMMREEQEQRLQSQQTPARLDMPTTPVQTPVAAPVTPLLTPVATPGVTLPNGLTPEQVEKMERNKRLAMEKRAARLAAQQTPGSTPPATTSATATETTGKVEDIQQSQAEGSQQTDATKVVESSPTSMPEAGDDEMTAVDTPDPADQVETSKSAETAGDASETTEAEQMDTTDNTEQAEVPSQSQDSTDSHDKDIDQASEVPCSDTELQESGNTVSQKAEDDSAVDKSCVDESNLGTKDNDETLPVNRYTELETEDEQMSASVTATTENIGSNNSDNKTDGQTAQTEMVSSACAEKETEDSEPVES